MATWCITRVKDNLSSGERYDMEMYYSVYGVVTFFEVNNRMLRIQVETDTATQPFLEIGDTIDGSACSGLCICKAPVFDSYTVGYETLTVGVAHSNDVTFTDGAPLEVRNFSATGFTEDYTAVVNGLVVEIRGATATVPEEGVIDLDVVGCDGTVYDVNYTLTITA